MQGIIIVGIIIFFLILVICLCNAHYGFGDASVKFRTEGGSTIATGHGSCLGEAVADGMKDLYSKLSLSSHKDTIESRLSVMEKTLFDNRNRMYRNDVKVCEYYISQTKLLLERKRAEEERQRKSKEEKERLLLEQRQAEKEEKYRKEKEKKAEALKRKKEKEKERNARKARDDAIRREREKNLPEQRRFIAEQRRLMTDALRYEVLRRDGFRCQICGATAADGYKLHVDHIIPVSKGGKTEMSNLRVLCERCNMGKRDKIETIITPMKEQANLNKKDKNNLFVGDASQNGSCDHEEIIQFLKDQQVEYIDKTDKGGSLYFFDETIANKFKQKGFLIHYTKNGTKGTSWRAAWYIKL